MKSVGKQLQEARQARNWTPELAARETKIKVDRLRDLELDDYTHFSSPTYARGFVRTYARALGLDEYKILRQLDTKLPEDETSSFGADTGIPYVPEPSKAGQTGSGINPGLYVVLSLGLGVTLLISFILFEAYRAGVLPAYFAENSSTDQIVTPVTNEAPAVARAKPVDPNASTPSVTADNGDTSGAPKALPVDPNAAPPPVTTDNGDSSTAPRALPVDPNALNANATAPDPNAPVQAMRALPVDPNTLNANAALPNANDPNAPVQAVRALPVDPSQLNNPPTLVAVGSTSPTAPLVSPDDNGTNASVQAVRALPVDPSQLAAATNAAPNDPSAQAPTQPAISAAARESNSGPVHMPPVSAPAASPGPMLTPQAQAQVAATPTNSAAEATSITDSSAEKPLVLTASRDSFVRVTSEDATGAEKVLFASVIHTGQSVGFDGRKFSINVGIPSAVDITLDGVNYGPHSDQEAPETFTVESHQP